MSCSLKNQEKALKSYFNEQKQKSDNDQKLMLGVYLSKAISVFLLTINLKGGYCAAVDAVVMNNNMQ